MVTEVPGHGGEQALGHRRAGGAGLQQDERAGAVRGLDHPGGEAGLPEEGGLLVAEDPRERHAEERGDDIGH